MDPQPPRPPRVAFVGGKTPDNTRASEDRPVDPHWVELSALVSRAEANRVEMSRLQAERADLCAEALDLVTLRVVQREAERRESGRRGGELGDTIPLREVLAELSAALRVGERTVSSWLGDGAALVNTYPATLDALRAGRIDERHASAIIDAGIALSPGNRAEYEALIVPVAESETAPATRQYARIIAARLQPDIVAENAQRAFAERCVRVFDLDDGLARILLDGPAVLIHGIYDRLTAMGIAQAEIDAAPDAADAKDASDTDADADGAGAADADGAGADAPSDLSGASDAEERDERTLDQRRADILGDLLLTAAPTLDADAGLDAIRATVHVTIPILTLTGADDDPALLDGHSPIDPDTARALAAAAPAWQRVMTRPVTAEPVRLDTYRPSKRLRRLIAARDQHCRWPGCRRKARRSETDHTIAWEDGGPTCPGNLEILCKKHHTLKHASLWHVTQLGHGVLEFTSPTGRRYRNNAPPTVTATAGRPAWAHLTEAVYDFADPAPF